MLSKEFLEEYEFNNKSGKMSSEKFVSNNYIDDYNYIKSYTKNLDIPFKQKVYHTVHNIDNIVLCKNYKCNNPVKFKNSTIGYLIYCSNKCVGSDPNIIKQKEEKSLLKFGTKTPAESKKIKEKIIKTNNDRYGGNSPMSSIDIQEKSKTTLLKNWGVDNPNKNETINKKRSESFKENIDSYLENYKKTSLEKYGVEHPWMDKDIHKKSDINSKKIKEKVLYDKVLDKIKTYDNLKLIDIDYNTRNIVIKCSNCNKNFSIHREYLHVRYKENNTICTNCNPMKKHISGQEKKLISFIKSIYKGKILLSDRTLLNGKELDIYLPDEKIAFEYNGLYWHSELHKEKTYHSDKSEMCKINGVQLIHIWEDDWILKRDIIESIILNRLNKTKNKIFGRKCEIREVPLNESKKFLNENHIQGSCSSSIKIGLYHNNELVSLMSFGKPRNSQLDNSYELMRFCNKKNTNVVGSSSKLFKYFIKKYNPNIVISYSDISIFSGEMYEKLGFVNTKKSSINYKWVIGKKREHKSKFRKSNLIKMGYDKNKSEREIMYENLNSFRVWDCGLMKWEYKPISDINMSINDL
jgi:hypothetical protein